MSVRSKAGATTKSLSDINVSVLYVSFSFRFLLKKRYAKHALTDAFISKQKQYSSAAQHLLNWKPEVKSPSCFMKFLAVQNFYKKQTSF